MLCSIIVVIMVLPISQIQGMHDVAWLAILGTVGMSVAGADAGLGLWWASLGRTCML